jgi:hypothetical protein
MRLSRSHDLDHEFGRLTRVDSVYFFKPFFNLVFFKLGFIIFLFVFYWFIMISKPEWWVWKVNQGWPGFFLFFFNWIFFLQFHTSTTQSSSSFLFILFFKFYHWILICLGIGFHICFQFTFYGVIMISWI